MNTKIVSTMRANITNPVKMEKLIELLEAGCYVENDSHQRLRRIYSPEMKNHFALVDKDTFDRFMRVYDLTGAFAGYYIRHSVGKTGCIWVISKIDHADLTTRVVKMPKNQTWSQMVNNPAYGRVYRMAPAPSLKEARALKIGDIITAWFQDSDESSEHIVLQRAPEGGDSFDVMVMPLSYFGASARHLTARRLNTDRWQLSIKTVLEIQTYPPVPALDPVKVAAIKTIAARDTGA